MNILRYPLLALLIATLFACQGGLPQRPTMLERLTGRAEEQTPWTSQKVTAGKGGQFTFAIVSDLHGGGRPGVFERAVDKLNLLQPAFVMSVGDLIEGYSEDPTELNADWDQFEGFVGKLTMPFCHIPGNHDLSNATQLKVWEERFGPPVRHFNYHGALFLCLDTEDPPGSGQPVGRLSDNQIDEIERAVNGSPRASWTFVFMHEPLWLMPDQQKSGWARVAALLKDRPHTVFAGHFHNYQESTIDGHEHIVLATTGGGVDALNGPRFGQFDEVVWVTMTGDGPKIANLSLDGIQPSDVVNPQSKPLVDGLLGEGWVQGCGLVSREALFEGGRTTLNLANPTSQPLTVRGTFTYHEHLRPEPYKVEVTLPPGGKEAVPLRLKTDQPTANDELDPLELNLTATAQPAGGEPLSLAHTAQIYVDRARECPPLDPAPKLDGGLTDWEEIAFIECKRPAFIEESPDRWQGEQDGHFRFATAHDSQFVYLAVETFDDKVMWDPKKTPWDQDGVMFCLDARLDPLSRLGGGEWFKDYLLLELSPGTQADQPNWFMGDKLPAGTRAACTRSDHGLIAEVAIPVAYLNERQGGKWTGFRLNAAMIDNDQPGEHGTALWWRPKWEMPSRTYAGSGTFLKR